MGRPRSRLNSMGFPHVGQVLCIPLAILKILFTTEYTILRKLFKSSSWLSDISKTQPLPFGCQPYYNEPIALALNRQIVWQWRYNKLSTGRNLVKRTIIEARGARNIPAVIVKTTKDILFCFLGRTSNILRKSVILCNMHLLYGIKYLIITNLQLEVRLKPAIQNTVLQLSTDKHNPATDSPDKR
jgi:hypothetical protein